MVESTAGIKVEVLIREATAALDKLQSEWKSAMASFRNIAESSRPSEVFDDAVAAQRRMLSGLELLTAELRKNVDVAGKSDAAYTSLSAKLANLAGQLKRAQKSLDGFEKSGTGIDKVARSMKTLVTETTELEAELTKIKAAVDSGAGLKTLGPQVEAASARFNKLDAELAQVTTTLARMKVAGKGQTKEFTNMQRQAASLGKFVGILRGQMRGLESATKATTAATKRGSEAHRKSVRATQRASQQLLKLFSTLTLVKGGVVALAAAFGVWRLKSLAEEGVRLAAVLDKTSIALTIIAGSAERAGEQMKWLEEVSERTGTRFIDNVDHFKNMTAAAEGTELQGKKVADIFELFVGSSARLGLSAADTGGVMRALTQIISKNRVASEELRRQLGDRLPGAFTQASKALGVTNQELNKMLELGELTAEDLLPKFAAQYAKTFGAGQTVRINTMQASLGRLATAFDLIKAKVGFELKDNLDAFSAAMQELEGNSDALARSLAFYPGLALDFAGAAGKMGASVSGLDPIMEAYVNAQVEGSQALTDTLGPFDKYLLALRKFSPVMTATEAAIGVGTSALRSLGIGAATAGGDLDGFVRKVEQYGAAVKRTPPISDVIDLSGFDPDIFDEMELGLGDLTTQMRIFAGDIADVEKSFEDLGLTTSESIRLAAAEVYKLDEAVSDSGEGFRDLSDTTEEQAEVMVAALDKVIKDIELLPEAQRRATVFLSGQLSELRDEYLDLSLATESAKKAASALATEEKRLAREQEAATNAVKKNQEAILGNRDALIKQTAAVVDAIAAMEAQGRVTEESTANIASVISGLVDEFKKFGLEAPAALEALAKQFPILAEEADKADDSVGTFADNLISNFAIGIDTMDLMIAKFRELREEQGGPVAALETAADLTAEIDGLNNKFSLTAKEMSRLGEAEEELRQAKRNLTTEIKKQQSLDLAGGFTDAVDASDDFSESVDETNEVLDRNTDVLWAVIENTERLGEATEEATSLGRDLAESGFKPAADATKAFGEELAFVETSYSDLGDAATIVADQMRSGTDEIGETGNALEDTVGPAEELGKAMTETADSFTSDAERMSAALGSVVAQLKTAVKLCAELKACSESS